MSHKKDARLNRANMVFVLLLYAPLIFIVMSGRLKDMHYGEKLIRPVLFAYAQKPLIHAYADVRCLIFGQGLHLHPCLMCLSSEGPSGSAHWRRLAVAFIARHVPKPPLCLHISHREE